MSLLKRVLSWGCLCGLLPSHRLLIPAEVSQSWPEKFKYRLGFAKPARFDWWRSGGLRRAHRFRRMLTSVVAMLLEMAASPSRTPEPQEGAR